MPPPSRIDRRDFLLAIGRPRRVLELSCERLCMQYLAARADGRLAQLIAALERQLSDVDELRLLDREWLAHDDFRAELGPVLLGRERGGRIHRHIHP